MQSGSYLTTLSALLLMIASFTAATAQQPRANGSVSVIPSNVLLRIMRAEDERRWDKDLASLLTDKNAQVRKRAALAAGRIGDERAVPALIGLLRGNDDTDVRQIAAFGLGEIESSLSADALIQVLDDTKQPGEVRARTVEALGKIAAALPQTEEARRLSIGQVILNWLAAERREGALTESGVRNRELELLGLTAVLRARPADAGKVVMLFLSSADPRIRADAANTLARLRAKDGVEDLRQLLVTDQSPIVRANAARALGAAEDKQAFDALLDRALHDDDLRVRASAIRALGSLKDGRAATPLLDRGKQLLSAFRSKEANKQEGVSSEANEMLEIAAAIGRASANTKSPTAVAWLRQTRATLKLASPEVEVAFARVAAQLYQIDAEASLTRILFSDPNAAPEEIVSAENEWRRWANVGQGLTELATAKTGNPILDASIREASTRMLSYSLNCPPYSETDRKFRPKAGDTVGVRCVPLQMKAISEFLRAYAAFKPTDLADILRKSVSDKDVIIRATAAELLGSLPPDEANARALTQALPIALRDTDLNDAALAILDALGKQKSKEANDAIKTALDSSDHLIRRRAVALLKANGVGDFSSRIGTVKTRNTAADYRRAIARIGKHVTATVVTSKGSFTMEFLPEDAPLTVDNFIQLARKGFFNGQTIPRVVPNFVIQAGDPRGDTNGGPGYSIRCEINEVAYERAAVGMALSGKDTGGSQWFVTHSPQPHLDGGYTVFGRVIRRMDVVDRIARGDIIRRVIVNEKN